MSDAISFYATTANYIKGAVKATARKNPSLAMLQERGRVVKNKNGGTTVDWNIRVGLPTVQNTNPLAARARVSHNPLTRVSLDWAHYEVLQPISKFARSINRGASQMTNLMEETVDTSVDAVKQRIGNGFYQDGALLTNEIYGCNSWSSTSSANAIGVGVCNDTYAGLGTALATLGGDAPTGGTAWPQGVTLTPEYDAHTPLIVSSTNSYFGSASSTWAANCEGILTFAVGHSVRHDGSVETMLLSPDYWISLNNALRARHTMDISANSAMVKYGITGVINFAGMECVADYYCPAASGFGMNWEVVELEHLYDSLFPPPTEDEFFIDNTFNIGIDTWLQLKFKCLRSLVKIAELG